MRQDHPELLTTLRDVAATAVTLLDAFAQIRRERPPPPPPADPAPAPQDDPDDRPNASTNPVDAPETPSRPLDLNSYIDDLLDPKTVEGSARSFARVKTLLQQRAAAREQAASIHQRLLEIADMVSAVSDHEAAGALPLLNALLGQLCDDFSYRRGAFAAPLETDPS